MSKKETTILYLIFAVLVIFVMAVMPRALDHQLQKQMPPQYVKDAETAQKLKDIQEGQ